MNSGSSTSRDDSVSNSHDCGSASGPVADADCSYSHDVEASFPPSRAAGSGEASLPPEAPALRLANSVPGHSSRSPWCLNASWVTVEAGTGGGVNVGGGGGRGHGRAADLQHGLDTWMESLALMQAAFKGRQESVETTKERPEGLQDSRRNGLREKLWEIGIRGNICRMIKKMKEFARSAVMVDGEISKCVDILKGVAQGCTLSPNAFKVYMNDMIVAVEAAKRTVTVGEDTVSE